MVLKRVLIVANIIVVFTFIWMGQKQQSFHLSTERPTLPLVGYFAPAFSLETFGGEMVSFEEDLVGKPLFLNFWASWCPPCRAEMPDLVEVAHLYEGEMTFIGINVATQDNLKQSIEFLEHFQVPYVNLLDKTGEISRLYQVPPIPATIVIDEQGKIVYRKLGGMTKSEMIAAVEKGIGGK